MTKKQRIEELERKVAELEKRIKALELRPIIIQRDDKPVVWPEPGQTVPNWPRPMWNGAWWGITPPDWGNYRDWGRTTSG